MEMLPMRWAPRERTGSKPQLWPTSPPMPGACMICMATFGSGAGMATGSILINQPWIPLVRRTALIVFCAVGGGTVRQTFAAHGEGTYFPPGTRAMILVFASLEHHHLTPDALYHPALLPPFLCTLTCSSRSESRPTGGSVFPPTNTTHRGL